MSQPLTKNLKKTLLQKITEACSSVCIAVAWFTDQDLLDALVQRATAGIKVEVVISNDSRNFSERYSLDFSELENAGGRLYVWEETFFHSKYSIIDQECVFLGSANYTYSGFHKNHEITLLVNDPVTVSWLSAEFKKITDYFKVEEGVILSPLKYFYEQEIGFLYKSIQWLEIDIAEAEKKITQYEVLYRIRFQELINEILYLKKLRAEKRNELIDKPETRKVEREAQKAWESFKSGTVKDVEKKKILQDESLQNQLRTLYREAVKLCHPDNPGISEDKKELSAKIFDAVKKAYDDNDEALLKSLLEDLQSGLSLNQLDYKTSSFEKLETVYTKLKNKYDSLFGHLQTLKQDPRYLFTDEDLEKHFSEKELVLKEELEVLKLDGN